MDIELLSTFLEVNNTRHFGKAAENLYLTQAAVSARIKQLEQTFGTNLFVRYRNNISLTPTGERLIPHAEAIISSWNLTRQELSLTKKQNKVLTLGSTSGLSELCYNNGLSIIHQNMRDIALRAEICEHNQLVKRILDRTVDLGFLYDPPKITELKLTQISDSELVLISSKKNISVDEAISHQFISVDWGISYSLTMVKYFPNIPSPILHTTLAKTALEFILSCGGSAYLPLQLIHHELDKTLFIVDDAPIFQRPIYASYHTDNIESDKILKIIDLISQVITPPSNEQFSQGIPV